MSTVPVQLPDDLEARASALAEASGVSLSEYVATMLASRVDAQREAESRLAARAKPGQARAVLQRSGIGTPPRLDDELD